MKRYLLAVCFLVLVTAVLVPLLKTKDTSPGKGPHLAQMLPASLPGWESREMQLGQTEAVQGAVEKTLRYDDVFFREFRSARASVSVYIAYWAPGKMPTQLVASHTPDRCWSSAGWICDEIKHQLPLAAGVRDLRPGEWRLFRAPNGERLQVQYWHLVGDRLYDYGDRFNRTPSAWRWWRDAARQIFQAPEEQYFIRVTSDRPFEELKGDPGWGELLSALAKLGLEAPKTED